jgi:hypothetical protein
VAYIYRHISYHPICIYHHEQSTCISSLPLYNSSLKTTLGAHKKLTPLSPTLETNALDRFLYLIPPNPVPSDGHRFWASLVRGVRRHAPPKPRRPNRPSHLRQQNCGAPWRLRPRTKQPLYMLDRTKQHLFYSVCHLN